jgi:hypothetical protein
MKSYLIKTIYFLLFAVLVSPAYAGYYNRTIDVSVVADNDGRLQKYPVSSEHNKEKAYIKAKKGQSYGIRVRNKTANRIGVVIAVDGRNIVSGKKSYLSKNERMYILGPFESSVYTGWRTGRNQVNRFYFSKAKNSYAAGWGDESAMGVIAVAAFEEKKHQYRKPKQHSNLNNRSRRTSKQAGTGFGEEEYSPVVSVHFNPQKTASYKSFLKYEWRHVLCKKGIISCHKRNVRHNPNNRFWDEDEDFAPYPVGRKNWDRY